MELEIEPEPTREEREAILAALDEQGADGARPFVYHSAWRDDGLRENAFERGPREPVEP